MTCNQNHLRLSLYVDGELDAVEVLALEEHARACAACKKELAALQTLQKTLRTGPLYHGAPADLVRAVKSQTSGMIAPKRHGF